MLSASTNVCGTPLHDSYHIGETITNDYGRPYEGGFDNYSGVSGYATAGIFTLYARTEFQYASSATGYSQSLFDALSTLDNIPFVLVGNGLNFRMGRSIKYPRLPHNRLLLALAQGFGHKIEKFGNPDYCGGGALPNLS